MRVLVRLCEVCKDVHDPAWRDGRRCLWRLPVEYEIVASFTALPPVKEEAVMSEAMRADAEMTPP